MNRFAVFVDAGYFSAAAAQLVAGSPKRRWVEFDFAQLVAGIQSMAKPLVSPADLLRIYWYDGAKDAKPSTWHDALGNLPNVKVRLGHLRRHQQKGVDTLLVLDLVRLGEQEVLSDAVLIAGDEDLREGVAYIQARGVRVHLVVFDKSRFSYTLVQEADTFLRLGIDFFKHFARRKAPETLPDNVDSAAQDGDLEQPT